MMDMKQLKDNVSSKIKTYHEQEKPEMQDKKARSKTDLTDVVALPFT